MDQSSFNSSGAGAGAVSPAEHFNKIASHYEARTGGATRVIAKHLAVLSSPLGPDAHVLDNASGPGIVIDELLARTDRNPRGRLKITAVDAAPSMIDLIRTKSETSWKLPAGHVNAIVLAAEDLASLPDNTFSHSYTNFGFQFFKDPIKAAEHVYRTLKVGGEAKAFVTAWAHLGYMDAVWEASQQIRPGKQPLQLPFSDDWYHASFLENVLRKGGFQDVEVHEKESFFLASAVDEIAQSLGEGFATLAQMQGWTEDEIGKLPEALMECLSKLQTLHVDEHSATVPMLANVAVCRKLDV